MNILFRVDCNNKVGSGHLSRCYTLYKALEDKGHKIYFLTNNFNRKFFNKKIENLINYNSVSFSQNKDKNNTLKIIKNKKIDTLILDHYFINMNWCSFVKKNVKNFIIIDDDFKYSFNPDLYINFTTIKKYKSFPNKLIGLKYSIINPDYIKKISKNIKYDLFINFGTGRHLEYLKIVLDLLNDLNIIKNVLLVGNYKNTLKDDFEKLNFKVNLINKFEKLDNYIKESKICIGAGGMNLLERIFLRKINLVFSCANHQVALCKYLNNKNYINYFGKIESLRKKRIKEYLKKKIILGLKNSKYDKKLIDGRGVNRIVKKIENLNSKNKKL